MTAQIMVQEIILGVRKHGIALGEDLVTYNGNPMTPYAFILPSKDVQPVVTRIIELKPTVLGAISVVATRSKTYNVFFLMHRETPT